MLSLLNAVFLVFSAPQMKFNSPLLLSKKLQPDSILFVSNTAQLFSF